MQYTNESLSRMVEDCGIKRLIQIISSKDIIDRELANIWSIENEHQIMDILDEAWLPEDDWDDEFDYDEDSWDELSDFGDHDPDYTESEDMDRYGDSEDD